jgi:hypothetical protein
LTGYISDDKTIITRLQQKYLPDITLKKIEGVKIVISFRDKHANILSKSSCVSLDSTEQHIDCGNPRVRRDNIDINIMVDGFKLHDPFPNTT